MWKPIDVKPRIIAQLALIVCNPNDPGALDRKILATPTYADGPDWLVYSDQDMLITGMEVDLRQPMGDLPIGKIRIPFYTVLRTGDTLTLTFSRETVTFRISTAVRGSENAPPAKEDQRDDESDFEWFQRKMMS